MITAAGVSSGIDMALTLAARIAGDDVAQAIQLGIEYDPQPPFRRRLPRDRAGAHRGGPARADAGADGARRGGRDPDGLTRVRSWSVAGSDGRTWT